MSLVEPGVSVTSLMMWRLLCGPIGSDDRLLHAARHCGGTGSGTPVTGGPLRAALGLSLWQ
eukprot:767886-Hanusia_phi.AAC.1